MLVQRIHFAAAAAAAADNAFRVQNNNKTRFGIIYTFKSMREFFVNISIYSLNIGECVGNGCILLLHHKSHFIPIPNRKAEQTRKNSHTNHDVDVRNKKKGNMPQKSQQKFMFVVNNFVCGHRNHAVCFI